jgi:hypothetical protein
MLSVLQVKGLSMEDRNMISLAKSLFFSTAMLAALTMGALPVSAGEKDKFTVHEWGTFSTFSGSNGTQLKFYPNDKDLPDFVYGRHLQVKSGRADVMVSLETPVLYFYTDRDRTVSVHVDFPKGLMTDWYPQASRPPEHTIRWDDLKILAKDRPTLPSERDTGRYFAARETDAATVQTTGNDRRESEKFLFYRGVGDFQMPFVIRALGNGEFKIKNSGKHEIPAYILVNTHDRKISFKVFQQLSPGAEDTVELPTEKSTSEKLGDEMVKLLIEQGLYEKEARAMVKTWSRDWFEESGTRVLYLVAESLTDEFLPLKITPKPDRQVRVLVGRHDVLTPERERDVDVLVKRLHGPSNAEAKTADAELHKMLGRYRWPAQRAAEERLKEPAARR